MKKINLDPSKNLKKHFQTIYQLQAREYDLLVTREDHQKNLIHTIEKICAQNLKTPLHAASAIEVGAGTGRITAALLPCIHFIHAFDASEAMLEVAKEKLENLRHRNWKLGIADNESLPVESHAYHLSLAGWTFGHLTEWYPQEWKQKLAQVLSEFTRVLKPGGLALIIETLGTGRQVPRAPTPLLDEYYSILERQYQFNREEIRTDYHFESLEEAIRLTRFFFGNKIAQSIQKKGSPDIPEWTGIWWKLTDITKKAV